MMKQIKKTVKHSVLLILIGCLCTAPTEMFAADSTSTPEIVYTEPEEYSFQGVLWNSGKGAALVLPDTASGEWSSIQGDDNTGTVGGSCSYDV